MSFTGAFMPGSDGRAVVLWKAPPLDEHARKMEEVRRMEADARLAVARRRQSHEEMLQVGTDLVLDQLKKYLKLAQSPDFENATGPLEPKDVLKLAEFVSKNYRLDTGQATENVAHAIGPSIDFSRLSQDERDAWRALVTKGTGESGQ